MHPRYHPAWLPVSSPLTPTAGAQRLASLLTPGGRLKLLDLCGRSPEQLERELQPVAAGRRFQSMPQPPCRYRQERNVPFLPGLLSSVTAVAVRLYLYYLQNSLAVKVNVLGLTQFVGQWGVLTGSVHDEKPGSLSRLARVIREGRCGSARISSTRG